MSRSRSAHRRAPPKAWGRSVESAEIAHGRFHRRALEAEHRRCGESSRRGLEDGWNDSVIRRGRPQRLAAVELPGSGRPRHLSSPQPDPDAVSGLRRLTATAEFDLVYAAHERPRLRQPRLLMTGVSKQRDKGLSRKTTSNSSRLADDWQVIRRERMPIWDQLESSAGPTRGTGIARG